MKTIHILLKKKASENHLQLKQITKVYNFVLF